MVETVQRKEAELKLNMHRHREDKRPIRVTKANPCPICAKPDWCTVSADGVIAFCMRIQASKQASNGAWIHRLTEPLPPHRLRREKEETVPLPTKDMLALATKYFKRCEHPEILSGVLGISGDSLRRVGLGYTGRAWSFPMFDHYRRVVGIKLRPHQGRKFCVKGSHLGINWPKGLTLDSPLLICEGETDCAAALDLGFNAIGRPSCTGGSMIIWAFLHRHRYREAWIIADTDDPGLNGADSLAHVLRQILHVKIIHPPAAKDLRAWHNSGATRSVVEAVARNVTFE